LLSTG